MKTHFVGPEVEYGCPQESRSILWVTGLMELTFWMQVSGESSGFLDGKTRYWRSQRFLRSHKSLLDLSWIIWMMQDQSELYRHLINLKNTHEPSNPPATCLMVHETQNKRTPEDTHILLKDPYKFSSSVSALLSTHKDQTRHLRRHMFPLINPYHGLLFCSMLIF